MSIWKIRGNCSSRGVLLLCGSGGRWIVFKLWWNRSTKFWLLPHRGSHTWRACVCLFVWVRIGGVRNKRWVRRGTVLLFSSFRRKIRGWQFYFFRIWGGRLKVRFWIFFVWLFLFLLYLWLWCPWVLSGFRFLFVVWGRWQVLDRLIWLWFRICICTFLRTPVTFWGWCSRTSLPVSFLSGWNLFGIVCSSWSWCFSWVSSFCWLLRLIILRFDIYCWGQPLTNLCSIPTRFLA